MNELLLKLACDLAELVSRGVNHPAADQLIGGMKVALQQATDLAGSPPPPVEPVQAQLVGINEQMAEVTERMAKLLGDIDQRMAKLQETVEAWAK